MSERSKILFDPHFRTLDEVLSPEDQSRLFETYDVVWGKDEPMPLEEVAAVIAEVEVIVCADWRYGDLLYKAENLRAILTISGAFPLELDYDYCHQNHIRVMSAAPSFARHVAEMSLAMALAASREVVYGDQLMRQENEEYLHAGNKNTFMLYGQTVGMIGYGGIARELHHLLTPFGVDILAYDPWLADGYLRYCGVTPTSLDDLMRQSKVIFVLAVPSSENAHFLNRDKLSLIQKESVLVLMSRAHVVDFDAMTEMVLDGRFKVATDVFPTEPLDSDHPIRKASGAVLSAHRAGSVREGLWEIGEMVLDDLEAVTKGLPPRRMQNAEPELTRRYATNKAKSPNEA
jgi:phosphoglycerate dehydrogenase-like enzyme